LFLGYRDFNEMSDTKVEQYRVDIPVTIDRTELVKQFRVERTRPMMEKYLDEMIALAQPVVRAKGLYRLARVTGRDEGWVEIEGVRFNSKVLNKSLENIDTVVLYIFTCGKELDELPVSSSDRMHFLCLDMIKMQVSLVGAGWFMNFLKEKFQFPEITHLHPGEFADLPIEAQVPLFSLFEGTEKAIGAKLTSNKTIHPVKSGSGILFYNGASFLSCELCLQPHCTGRRVAYNPTLAEQFGIKVKKENV
jgi:hypothetical protein